LTRIWEEVDDDMTFVFVFIVMWDGWDTEEVDNKGWLSKRS
jgi:hypothetical protein